MTLAQILSPEFNALPLPDAPVPQPLAKTVCDKLLASGILALTAPVWAAILVWHLAQQARPALRGPLFYRETRITCGRPFTLLKFRVVRRDVAQRILAQTGAFHVRYHQDDPANCTPLGNFLKKFYLDELPQFLNVLRGDMSLVGPRPKLPVEFEVELAEGHTARMLLRTGLTGTVQIFKRECAHGLDGRALDNAYLRAAFHLSATQRLLLDGAILARTMRVLARGEGL